MLLRWLVNLAIFSFCVILSSISPSSVAQNLPDIVWTTAGYNSANPISSIAESVDGSFVASLQSSLSPNGWPSGLIAWSLPGGSFLRNIPVSGNAVAISPDSRLVAIGTDQSSASVFTVTDGASVKNLYAGSGRVIDVAFSTDGLFLAAAATNKLTVWDVSTWAVKKSWAAPTNVNSIVFLKDDTVIAGFRDGTLRRLNTESGASDVVATNQNAVRGLTLSPDGGLLGTVNFVDFRIYQTSDFSIVQSGSKDYRCNAFSPDGKYIAVGGNFNIEIRDLSTGSIVRTFPTGLSQLTAIRFSRDGKQLLAAAANRLYAWNTETWTLQELTENSDTVQSVSFSRDGKTVAFGSWNGPVRLRNVVDKALIRNIDDGTSWRLDSVRFSPASDLLAVGRGDSVIRLYDSGTGGLIRKLTGHTSVVSSLSFSTNGQTLASGSWDNTVRIWRVVDASPLVTINVHTGSINDVSISGDGQIVASSSQDNSLRLFHVSNGSQIFAWTNSIMSPPLGVSISPRQKFLAACDSNGALRIWNINTTALEKTIFDAGFACAYSANGDYLATIGAKIRIFNAANSQLVAAYDQPTSAFGTSIAVSPQGNVFAFGRSMASASWRLCRRLRLLL